MCEKKSPNTAEHESFPRPVNDEEWADLSECYPKLTRANVYITDPGCYDGYNCIGWTVDDTELEYDVGSVREMVDFYKSQGFEEVQMGADVAEVDLMAISGGYMASHATKRYAGPVVKGMPTDLWESKWYPSFRFTHGRYELEDDPAYEEKKKKKEVKNTQGYGKVMKSFRRSAAK